MRVSREQAQASRRRIVATSSALFRERGFEGIGIADLMKASGMTNGGFYRHFTSKDDLAKEAVNEAFQQLEAETMGKSIEAILTRYISPGHRDELGDSCPLSSWGSDVMRQADLVQGAFAQGVQVWLGMIDAALAADAKLAPQERRAKAMDLAARAVGAIVLSRTAAADPHLSDEILKTCLAAALSEVKATAEQVTRRAK